MFDLILSLSFFILALRVAVTVRRESAIFAEFAQSRLLAILVFLFPLGPATQLVLTYVAGWLPAAVITAACYLPALVSSRRLISVFDRSGTDRTHTALRSAHEAFGAALAGIIYVAIVLVLNAGVTSVGSDGF